jgi:hypothetical protein
MTLLKPINLIQAAESDLNSRHINLNYAARGNYRQYAFHSDHVRKATCVEELLIAAIALPDPEKPLKIGPTKKNTRMLYSDEYRPLLKLALVLVQQRHSNDPHDRTHSISAEPTSAASETEKT